jgi:hypothetical protein
MSIDLKNMRKSEILAVLFSLLCLTLSGCNQQNSSRLDFQMGEKIPLGPLTYNVIQSAWRNQLGEGFKIRSPQQRFLLIGISITNGGGKEVALPLFKLEDERGQSITESDNPQDVPNGIGILRSIAPAQTLQGNLLFDVPLASYKLMLTDGGEPGLEKTASVNIPLRMDVDSGVQAPTPGRLK